METLIDSLFNLMVAKQEHDNARQECEYDWDYFGRRQISRLDASIKDFEQELNRVIDARIKQIENKKGTV